LEATVADNVHKYGFRWYRGNGYPMPSPIEYAVADAYQATIDGGGTSVDLNIGDPVKYVSDGSVALANTTDLVFGIVVGVSNLWDSSLSLARPSDRVPGATTGGGILSRQTRVMVVPAKAGYWEIDVDDAVTATTEAAYQALVHGNVEHVCPGDTSNSSRPKADPKLDISSVNTTAGLGWRIMAISKTANNRDFSGANVKLVVAVNDSSQAGSAATNVAGI
jgi:hypothetical protein